MNAAHVLLSPLLREKHLHESLASLFTCKCSLEHIKGALSAGSYDRLEVINSPLCGTLFLALKRDDKKHLPEAAFGRLSESKLASPTEVGQELYLSRHTRFM